MSAETREQRQLYLIQKGGIFQVCLYCKETGKDGFVADRELYIDEYNVFNWKIIQGLLKKFTNCITTVEFEDGTLFIRYLCPSFNKEFVKVYDYIWQAYEDRQERFNQ